MTADLYDAINQNTRASGNWGKKGAPKIAPWPRPTHKKKSDPASDKPTTVADIWRKFQRR